MSHENSTTIDLGQTATKTQRSTQEKAEVQKKGVNPLKVLLFLCLGLFGLITLAIISWPLVAWLGSLRAS
jgi:hypothetical protein